MLPMFHSDVVKVDQDIVYVAMVVHVCCKNLSSMFHLFFHMYVASVFIWMLHMFHTYVACVLLICCVCLQWFSSVSDACFKCFICLQTYVASIAPGCFKSRSDVAHEIRVKRGYQRPRVAGPRVGV